MVRGPIEQALSQRKLLEEAIAGGVGTLPDTRYEPPGWTEDRSRLSFLAASEADPVRGERFAPFGVRVLGATLDILAILVIWFLGFAGLAAFAVPVYTVLPENSSTVLSPLFHAIVTTVPFWTIWVFNAQGWSPAGRVTDLRAVNALGAPPGVRAGLVRTIAFLPSILPLGIGFWAAALDSEGQTWHDRIAGTRVIQLLR